MEEFSETEMTNDEIFSTDFDFNSSIQQYSSRNVNINNLELKGNHLYSKSKPILKKINAYSLMRKDCFGNFIQLNGKNHKIRINDNANKVHVVENWKTQNKVQFEHYDCDVCKII